MFYVPECGSDYEELKEVILANGGLVVDQHECYTYQIKPQEAKKLKHRDFYQGTIYLSDWIMEQVAENQKTPMKTCGNEMNEKKDDHFLQNNNSGNCKKLNISKKKKFTIVEGIKLFSIISTNATQNMNKPQFWQKLCEQRMIPERSPEQLKKFWLTYKDFTPEQWLAEAIHERIDFSLSLKSIPSEEFVRNFKQKYEMEFIRLETLDPIVDKSDGPSSKSYTNGTKNGLY